MEALLVLILPVIQAIGSFIIKYYLTKPKPDSWELTNVDPFNEMVKKDNTNSISGELASQHLRVQQEVCGSGWDGDDNNSKIPTNPDV